MDLVGRCATYLEESVILQPTTQNISLLAITVSLCCHTIVYLEIVSIAVFKTLLIRIEIGSAIHIV